MKGGGGKGVTMTTTLKNIFMDSVTMETKYYYGKN